jgi:hypothetical protein
MYRLHVDDRNYESFSIYDSTNMDKVELSPDFNPLTHHLFSNDLFSLSSTNEVKLLHSNVRNYEYISGVLILENDKTYGSVVPISTVLPSKSTYVSLSKKHYYKCIPDDIHLPTFLIPYEAIFEAQAEQGSKVVAKMYGSSSLFILDKAFISACMTYFLLKSRSSQKLSFIFTFGRSPLYPVDNTLPSLFKIQHPTFL